MHRLSWVDNFYLRNDFTNHFFTSRSHHPLHFACNVDNAMSLGDFTGDRWFPRTPVTRKMFVFDVVIIMNKTFSWGINESSVVNLRLVIEQSTTHFLIQWLSSYWRIYASPSLYVLKWNIVMCIFCWRCLNITNNLKSNHHWIHLHPPFL